MLSEEQKQFNRTVIAKQEAVLARDEWHSCGNCTNLRYHAHIPMCALFQGAAPPIATLVCGCEHWESAVPF